MEMVEKQMFLHVFVEFYSLIIDKSIVINSLKMKVLFEVPLESSEYLDSHYEWLSDPSNRLFLIEGGKRLRTISIGTEPGKVLESANLADSRVCTNFSWNKDGDRLAMVVDKRLIYFWDVRDNNLVHYKPSIKISNETNSAPNRNRSRDVERIAWSRTTNKVVIGYSSGQLLLCNHERSNLTETLIDNSSGVLREAISIESSPHSDVFACITVIFELLVMTFDGEAIFYNQGGDHGINMIKFSPLFMVKTTLANHTEHDHLAEKLPGKLHNHQPAFWLAHNGRDNQIYFKLIELKERHPAEVYPMDNLVHHIENQEDQRTIYYEWIDSNSLILCSIVGIISLVQINTVSLNKSNTFHLKTMKLLEIHAKETFPVELFDASAKNESTGTQQPNINQQDIQVFKTFKLISHKKSTQNDNRLENLNDMTPSSSSLSSSSSSSRCSGKSFSFAAMTIYKMFYYELLEIDNDSSRYVFEKIDELDLTGSLKKIGLQLERLEWSFDSSMLAVQLTNGHILIYQTRLNDHMVTSYGSKTAYISDPNEITILNYGFGSSIGGSLDATSETGTGNGAGTRNSTESTDEVMESSSANRNNLSRSPLDKDNSSLELTSKASIIRVDLKPSVFAIGPNHLVVGLNNLVRFYSINSGEFKFQEEYHSIVSSICLCSKFVSVQFDDNRIKLHPLKKDDSLELLKTRESSIGDNQKEDNQEESFHLNERYFPDPTKFENISAFTLTNDLFIYCTSNNFNLYLFCLNNWIHVQSFSYQISTMGQIIKKLVPDGRANKYLCLTETSARSRCRVFLYDSYRNEMMSFLQETRTNGLYAKIFQSQLNLVPSLKKVTEAKISIKSIPSNNLVNRRNSQLLSDLSRIINVIWDTDGRSVLLIERKYIHIFVILDHTLESEGSIIEWAATIGKQSTYATLYASHGVISFQTSLGRVINSISESHDDEAKLNKLSQQIQTIITGVNWKATNDGAHDSQAEYELQAEIMQLKLEYLQIIVLIYPLSKCAEICEYIMSDQQFNVSEQLRYPEIDDVLWRQLAARALFTSNLQFALLVYKRRRLQVFARALAEIMDDSSRFGFDSKTSVTTRLLILLGCDTDDE